MARLVWTERSLSDVARLHRFLAAENASAAARAIAAIRSGVRILRDFPEIGRRMDAPYERQREWMIHFGAAGYVVVYRYDEAVNILAVRHMRELPRV